MRKKVLRKNEFRMDLNPRHFGKDKKPHPAYITARYKHMYKANLITHSRKTNDGKDTYLIGENPNKLSKDKRQTRISPPFWQKEEQFSRSRLQYFRFSNNTRKKIIRYNKKFK